MRFKSSGLFPFRLIRTGIRCSTFTKFPVALSCEIIEKAAPVASEMDSTTPLNVTFGTASAVISTSAPSLIFGSWVSR